MNPSRTFILRPVATTLLMAALLLVGFVSFPQLPVSALPDIDYPTIQIVTFYPGASPDVMASAITAPLERQLGQMPGLAQMTSTSSDGCSVIVLQFLLELNIDIAEQEVQAAINQSNTYLPADLPAPPIYSKTNPADAPVLTLALTSTSVPLSQVEDLADTRLAQKIAQVAGVGVVTISGQKPAVRIQADPDQLSSYGINLEDIRTALQAASTDLAKGSFDGKDRAYQIDANDQISTAADYKGVVVAWRNGSPVMLSDVANVIDDVENTKLAAWMNETPAVILNVQRQPGANTIQVVNRIKQLLPKLRSNLPGAVDLQVLTDRTTTIRASVSDVEFELALTVGLVILVIFLFLRSVPATIIPGVAVPLSLIGTLGVMYLLGFSLDNLSLMALTISTGFVVDDAIVMIENVMRYIEAGETPMEAALKGSAQIGFTIVSLTISLIAVLIPLLFMGDIVGRLFREFAVTLSVTILLSALVSLTLTPMMCARLLKKEPEGKRGRFYEVTERGWSKLNGAYARTLKRVLDHQPLVLIFAVATLVLTIFLYIIVPKGFFPTQDTGVILGLSQARESMSFPGMAKRQQELAKIILKDPAVDSLSSFIGIDGTNTTLNSGRIQINLKPIDKRDRADKVIARLQKALANVEGITLAMQAVQDLSVADRVSQATYQVSLADPDQAELNDATAKLVAKMKQMPDLTDVGTDQQNDGLAASLTIDRQTASRLGISASEIDNTLDDAFGQRQISTLYTQVNQYHVVLETSPSFQKTPDALKRIYVRSSLAQTNSTSVSSGTNTSTITAVASGSGNTPTSGPSNLNGNVSSGSANPTPVSSQNGGAVPLGTFTKMAMKSSPLSITHQGQFPVVTISFNLKPGASLGAATSAIEKAEEELKLPISVQFALQGSASSFKTSLAKEPILILAALITVYLVLGILYESFIHPITILSTLPSAGVGACLAMLLTGTELSVVSIIGIILLIGIVKKNGIMMVDFALDAERTQHMTSTEAIYQACLLRFRPILMTTMAALLAGIPLVFGSGIGSELRRPLGIAMVGGLLVSQVLTLYTTPVIYIFFDGIAQRFAGGKGDKKDAKTTGHIDEDEAPKKRRRRAAKPAAEGA